jgi:flagellar biosynthesis/type III secretory pathway protein FliH
MITNECKWTIMVKKCSKNQLKQLTTAEFDNTAPSAEETAAPILNNITATPAALPVDSSRDNKCAPTTTQLLFFKFITLVSTEDIKRFLKLASTTPESEEKNLENLWRRAHGEGYENGRKSVLWNLEKKMEENYEEGLERGMDLGWEQGYNIAKVAFNDIVKELKARESRKLANTTVPVVLKSPVRSRYLTHFWTDRGPNRSWEFPELKRPRPGPKKTGQN